MSHTLNSTIEQVKLSIANLQRQIDTFDASEYVDHDMYDEMLDGCYGTVEIAGMSYSTSRALKGLDPVAYRCGFNDYVDSVDLESIPEYQELLDNLEETENELSDLLEQQEEEE